MQENDGQKDFEKVYVDLPNHWAVSGESLWAKPLSNNLYEIQNVPFYAYGLNFLDVVQVDASAPDLKPEVIKIVRQSGHKTFRIFFSADATIEEQRALFAELEKLSVSVERANEHYVALDLQPDADYDAVKNKLEKWEQEEILEFETCEARVENGFDDVLQDDSDF